MALVRRGVQVLAIGGTSAAIGYLIGHLVSRVFSVLTRISAPTMRLGTVRAPEQRT